MNVSVIIPAFNAAETIADTVNSLCAQTFQRWEAIIVDDGSSDESAAIVTAFSEQDHRIQLVQQNNQGASAARNTGIARANGDWFLFLDADDWLLPQHLERMVGKLQTDKTLDAVHCGWARVSPSGHLGPHNYAPDVPDMFDLFAQYCAFQPHACLIRSSLVRTVGGFEISLRSCQDWDLWQRIARSGARFGAVRESLARYRTRPGSISLDGFQLIKDGLHVITQGHAADNRVPNPAHPFGRNTEYLASARLHFVAWPAGLVLGVGRDARPLLRGLQDDHDPQLSPLRVAAHLFEAALLSQGRSKQEWAQLWPQIDTNVISFLQELERQSGASGLAQQALRELEASIAGVIEERPFNIGQTVAIELDITSTLPERLHFNEGEQLHCHLRLAQNDLGAVKLPVVRGLVKRLSLADAIAGDHAWPILGRFFEETIYRQLRIEKEAGSLSLWRGDLRLAKDLPCDETFSWSDLHDDIGWTLFLQEVWGKPAWPAHSFYDPHQESTSATCVYSISGKLHIEISDRMPDVLTHLENINITATVGGAELGTLTLPVTNRTLSAQEIRVAVTSMADFELCRLAVRQALIGWPLDDPPSLRSRLQEAYRRRATPPNNSPRGESDG